MKKKNKLRHMILLILGIAGILDTIIVLLFFSGFNTGVVLPGIIGIILLSYSIYKMKTDKSIIKNKLIKVFFISAQCVLVLSFIIIETVVVTNSFSSKIDTDAQYMIVLGAGLRNNHMTLALIYRLNKSLEILKQNSNIKVIVSGGKGLLETNTEAELMKNYLTDHNINPMNIIIEDKSTSTYENFIFSKKLIEPGINKIYVITNAFHTFRANMIAKRTGFEPISISAKDPETVLINCYLREYFAVIKSFIFDR